MPQFNLGNIDKSKFGYQEPSGYYRREFNFYRVFRQGELWFNQGLTTEYARKYQELFNEGVRPSSVYDTVLIQHAHGPQTDVYLPSEIFAYGVPAVTKFSNPGTLNTDDYRVLWYNYNKYRSRIDISGVAPSLGVAVSGIISALSGIKQEELVNLYYHDFGPSGNYLRRVIVPNSSLGADWVIPSGEEPLNPGVKEEVLTFGPGQLTVHNVQFPVQNGLRFPIHQAPSVISRRQQHLDAMFSNVKYNEQHPSFPHLNMYQDAFVMWTGCRNNSSVAFARPTGIGLTVLGLSHMGTIAGGSWNTIVSGIPCPAMSLQDNLILNNVSLKPTGWLDNNNYVLTNESEYLPGTNTLLCVESMNQVRWGYEYLRNICGIIELPSSRPSGILSVSRGSSPNYYKFQKVTVHPQYFVPSYTGVLSTAGLEFGCEFTDPQVDVLRSELNFSTTLPSGIDVNWSCETSGVPFVGHVTDRFGNQKTLGFKFQPILVTILQNTSTPVHPDEDAGDEPNYFEYHNKQHNSFVQLGPCSGSISLIRDKMRLPQSGVNFYSAFGHDSDYSGPERHTSRSNFYPDQDSSPFYWQSRSGAIDIYRENHLYTLRSMLFWEMICTNGTYSYGDVLTLNPPELSLSSGDFSFTIGNHRIRPVEYRNCTVYDKYKKTPEDYVVKYDFANHRGMNLSQNQRLAESGFLGRWSSLGYAGQDLSYSTGHEPLTSGSTNNLVGARNQAFPEFETWPIWISGLTGPFNISTQIFYSVYSASYNVPFSGDTLYFYDAMAVNGFALEVRNTKDEVLALFNYDLPASTWSSGFRPTATGQLCNYNNITIPATGFVVSQPSFNGLHYGAGFFNDWQYCRVTLRPRFATVIIDDSVRLPGSSVPLCNIWPPSGNFNTDIDSSTLSLGVRYRRASRPVNQDTYFTMPITIPAFSIAGTGDAGYQNIAVGQTANSWWPAS